MGGWGETQKINLVLRLKDEIKIKEVHKDGKLEMENALAQIIATRMENED